VLLCHRLGTSSALSAGSRRPSLRQVTAHLLGVRIAPLRHLKRTCDESVTPSPDVPAPNFFYCCAPHHMEESTRSHTDLARSIAEAYSPADRAVLLNWVQRVLLVRESDLGAIEKCIQVVRITSELGVTAPLLTHLLTEVRRHCWDDRSSSMRGVIGGAGLGLILSLASPMAGVAAFGGAVAVPVIVLGAGAGALLTAIADELRK